MCLQIIKCLKKECTRDVFTYLNLAHSGGYSSSYVHNQTISVECTDGYTFKNGDSTAYMTCMDGGWMAVPKCRRFANCQVDFLKNGYFQRITNTHGSDISKQWHLGHGQSGR